jgi:hypothetical protein
MDKRICYVQIQTPSGDKEIHNISMHGRVTRKMSETGSTADISIANLAKEDVEYLTTYTSPYVDQSKKKRINIFAGYESMGVGMIFSGDIYSALPSGKPDTWLSIKAKTEYFNQQNIITISQGTMSAKNLAAYIAAQLGVNLVWRSKSEKFVDAFNYAGAKAKLLNRLNQIDNFYAYIDNNNLYCVDRFEEPPLLNNSQPRSYTGTATKHAGTIKLVNQYSGMIGMPEPDEYGVKVKCLLDPAVKLGDWFKLESEMLPIVNGFYQVYELTFDFATREPQYYVEMYGKNKRV